MLKSFDPETGKLQWTFYSTPPPGTPGSHQRRRHRRADVDDRHLRSRAQPVYVGTGNPTPVLNGPARPGDNPWTCSIVALNPDTGSWRGASRRRRTTRTTGTRRKCRCSSTRTFNGAPRKLLLQASRNGYYFVLDRTTGKSLLTTPFADGELGEGHRQGRPADSRSGEGAGARRPARRAERSRRHQLSIAELRSGDRVCSSSARRTPTASTSSSRSTATYGWAGADYGVWGKGVLAGDRLPDRQDPLEHDLGDGGRRGRADDGDRADVHRRLARATRSRCARATAARCGTRASAASATRRSPTSSTAASTSWSPAAASSTRGRCRRRNRVCRAGSSTPPRHQQARYEKTAKGRLNEPGGFCTIEPLGTRTVEPERRTLNAEPNPEP